MKNKFKILITGGSGFIGTNMLQYFSGHEVLSIDICAPKLGGHNSFWSCIDILNYAKFREAVLNFNPDYIVHLAARTDLGGSTIEDYQANTVGVENLLRIVRELPNLRKVLITSSMLVCHTGYYPKTQFDYSPTTMYGKSKVETEKLVWANKPHCDWAIIRPTSIWGPWFEAPYRNFFNMVISHRYFHVGNKGCTKTYGYIGNAVYQIEQVLFNETLEEEHKVFYIGDEPPTNIEEWGNEIANELNYKIIRMPYMVLKCAALCGDLLKKLGIYFPMTSFRLKNMTTNNIIDLTEISRLAPNPPYTRIEGVKQTLNWLKENK